MHTRYNSPIAIVVIVNLVGALAFAAKHHKEEMIPLPVTVNNSYSNIVMFTAKYFLRQEAEGSNCAAWVDSDITATIIPNKIQTNEFVTFNYVAEALNAHGSVLGIRTNFCYVKQPPFPALHDREAFHFSTAAWDAVTSIRVTTIRLHTKELPQAKPPLKR